MRKKVLIVEDSRTQAERLKALIEEEGYEVQWAGDGEEALSKIATWPPDLVITDIVMPRMDGYELCLRLRADPRIRSIPIIMLTSKGEPLDIIKGLEVGADNFITKPYEDVLLLGRMRNVFAEQVSRPMRKFRLTMDLELFGKKISVTPERQQIVELLLSTMEELATTNQELRGRARELSETSARLTRATSELREAKAFLDHLISSSPVVIFRGRPGGFGLDYISPNVERLLGYPPEEILGVPQFWLEHIHPDERERVMAEYARAIETKAPQMEAEYPFLCKDGGYRWLYTLARLEYDEAANPTGFLAYALDITDRKTAEEAFKHARLEADRANQAKSEFLSRMSHELRTPLNAILGFAQLLEMDSLSLEQRESVGHILKGGRILLELINEVLDIARIESGRLHLSLEPVPLNAVVQETLDLIRPLAIEADVQPYDETASRPELHILADRQRLKQVLLNLLANAVKYNRKGGTVVLSYDETPQGRLRINVTDTGPGIPPERMDRLFTPFERLGAEQTGAEGTGLGLVLSRRLVETMGGTMGAESTVGRGSTFWVELALAESAVQRLEREGGDVPDAREFEAFQRARVLLYVEDNLSNLKLIQRVLAHRPEIRLIPAMQGRMGLDLAREHRPKLILLDLHLPDIQGEEVLRQLKEAPETRDIPVVVISADATPGQVKRLLAAGARNYLTKPLDVRKFLEIVDETLGGARSSDSLATH